MKISEKFYELKQKSEAALISYICVGDPRPKATKEYVESLVKGGTDIIELGLPFSDPIADGPTIQASIERALNSGMNPDLFFETVKDFDIDIPLVVMTYYNLIFKRGIEKFVKDCKDSNITGIIAPDLPIEESHELESICKKHDIDLIFLISPTTTDLRMKKILSKASGFIYLVARLGVTGVRSDVSASTKELLKRVKTDIPKAVGFGISNKKQASEIVKSGADGIIVGSAFVNIIAKQQSTAQNLEKLAYELKQACRLTTVD